MKAIIIYSLFIFIFIPSGALAQSTLVDANLIQPSITVILDESKASMQPYKAYTLAGGYQEIKVSQNFVNCSDLACIAGKNIGGEVLSKYKNIDFISARLKESLSERQSDILRNLTGRTDGSLKDEAWFKYQFFNNYILCVSIANVQSIDSKSKAELINAILAIKQGGSRVTAVENLLGLQGNFSATLYKIEPSELEYIDFLKNWESGSFKLAPKIRQIGIINGYCVGYSMRQFEGKLDQSVYQRRMINDALIKALNKFGALDQNVVPKQSIYSVGPLTSRQTNAHQLEKHDLFNVYAFKLTNDKRIVQKRRGSVRVRSVKPNSFTVYKNEMGSFDKGMMLLKAEETGLSFHMSANVKNADINDYSLMMGYDIRKLLKIETNIMSRLNVKVGYRNARDIENYSIPGLELPSGFLEGRMLYYGIGWSQEFSLLSFLKCEYNVLFNAEYFNYKRQKDIELLFDESFKGKYGNFFNLTAGLYLPFVIHRSIAFGPYADAMIYRLKNSNGIGDLMPYKDLGLSHEMRDRILAGIRLTYRI
jgi:hypothetical protein